MNAATSAPPDPRALPKARKLMIFATMALGMFMALIDIQIVAASLNDVQAGLAAGPDEISWVQTAYLMAELVMIPFSAFLAQAMSTRWLFTTSAALFTLSSIACGLAWNIESMTVFRALQGFTGGAMVPTAFSVGFAMFDEKERAIIPATLGMAGVLAPALGPTVGGLITDLVDWRWIFFINVLPGIVIIVATLRLVDLDRADPKMFGRIDWPHLLAMATALGCLQYVLEEGPRKDWFGDPVILTAAWVALVAFALFLERSFFSPNPIVRLSPFRNRDFVFSCVFNLVIGFGMFASIYLVPVFLARVRGFDSLQIGATVFVIGAGQLVSTLIAATAVNRGADLRIVIGIGLVGFAASMWLTSQVTPEWGFWELLVPQLVRGGFLMLCIVPSVNMAMAGFQGPELRYASGLFNLMRNLGGAIGIAVVNTWMRDFSRVGALRLGEGMAASPRGAEEATADLAGRLAAVTPDPHQALLMAQGLLGRLVGQEALTLAFNDIFRLMAWMFLAALVMVPFCSRQQPSAAPQEAH